MTLAAENITEGLQHIQLCPTASISKHQIELGNQ